MNTRHWKAALLGASLVPLAGALLLQSTRVLRTLHQGRAIVSQASAFEQRPCTPATRVLLVGDSTGLGVGARAGECLASLLAADHPDAEVVNLSRSGARLADVCQQVQHLCTDGPPWDLVLLHAGGNDILRTPRFRDIEASARVVLARLVSLARQVVWLGPANLGLLPLFVPPFTWLLSRRSFSACALFSRCADEAGVRFVNFCHRREQAFFAVDPVRFIAADLVHPNAEAYRHCYATLKRHVPHLWPGARA
jgi:lysophospholipase L1-like esterase